MTTRGCCHLPGSVCDCASSAGMSNSVEEAGSDGCQALYVTQVSFVLTPMSAQSDGPICRIYHEGGNSEGLLSPCNCTGTLGTVHKSCLEKCLPLSDTSYCELCHTEFSSERSSFDVRRSSLKYKPACQSRVRASITIHTSSLHS